MIVVISTTVIGIEKIMAILHDTKSHDNEEEALVLNTMTEEGRIVEREEDLLDTTRNVGID